MSTDKAAPKRHPSAIAWDEWLDQVTQPKGELRHNIATRIAEKIARLYFAGDDDEHESQDQMAARIKPYVSTELELVMKCLREALQSGGAHSMDCPASHVGKQGVFTCDCWVSQAQALIDEEK